MGGLCQDKHTTWEGLESRVRKMRYLVKENDTKTPPAKEWEIYDIFATLREGTKQVKCFFIRGRAMNAGET